ncbi:hypothetical protein [Metabacillus litoralis]|uniref:hypothetical protein n=1 Tax=Metabacillus litoralis TaxID=152268 RepID=UPI001CFC59D6|nr:hypothetical protein [Metabacillus litoralis]
MSVTRVNIKVVPQTLDEFYRLAARGELILLLGCQSKWMNSSRKKKRLKNIENKKGAHHWVPFYINL